MTAARVDPHHQHEPNPTRHPGWYTYDGTLTVIDGPHATETAAEQAATDWRNQHQQADELVETLVAWSWDAGATIDDQPGTWRTNETQ